MVNTVKDLIRKAQPYRHHHIRTFMSLMLPDEWYTGWNTQKAARRACARFNGYLAHVATLAGQYVISHPELSPQDHLMFIESGTTQLSRTGNLIFVANIQSAIRKVDPKYKPPSLAQVCTCVSSEAKKQASHIPARKVTLQR